jgi:hypothetical protein
MTDTNSTHNSVCDPLRVSCHTNPDDSQFQLCFDQLNIITLSLQNLEWGVPSAYNIIVIWDPMKLTNCIEVYVVHITLL